MAEMKKFLSTEGLSALVDQIKAEDAKVLSAAKSHAEGLASNYDEAGKAATAESNAKAYTDQLANGQVATNKSNIETLMGEGDGSVAKAVADAKALIDADVEAVEAVANKNKEDIAAINNAESGILAQAKAFATAEDAKVQGNIDTLAGTVADLDAYVGDIPTGYEETNVIAYINKKAQETLDAASGGSSESAASVLQALNTYKAENDPKVAKNTEDIATARAAADSAMEHSEGVAGDLATETSERKAADEAQIERIAALEGTIVGLSGAMHFEGVKDAVPEDVTGYEQGDVIIVGNKEYVLNGTSFVEFGDASVNAEAITTLTGRVDTLSSDMTQAKTDIDNTEAAILLKAEKTYVDEQVQALQGVDNSQNEKIAALEAKFGGAEGSVEDMIADAQDAAEATAAADATEKANKALTDAKAYTNTEVGKDRARLDALELIDHDHANKAELDLIATGDKAKWDAAAVIAHEHGNKTVLDGITTAKVAAWDAAEQNAKTFAQGLNDTMQETVNGIDGRVTKNAEDIALKAAAADLEDAVERIAANELAIAANTSAINSFTPITSDEVNALFA